MVTNIQWEDGAKKSGELYIADEPGKTWTVKDSLFCWIYGTVGDDGKKDGLKPWEADRTAESDDYKLE